MAVLVVGVALIAAGVYVVLRQSDVMAPSSDQTGQPVAPSDDQRVLEKLKKIILLPDDVTPTMAIVTDAELLKRSRPDFFADAEDGDRLVLYPDLAILYSDRRGQIIKVGPVQSAAVEPPQSPVISP
jgi:hypothetical protein